MNNAAYFKNMADTQVEEDTKKKAMGEHAFNLIRNEFLALEKASPGFLKQEALMWGNDFGLRLVGSAANAPTLQPATSVVNEALSNQETLNVTTTNANSSNQQVSSILLQIEADIESAATKGDYEVNCLVQAKQSQVAAVIAQLEAKGFTVHNRYRFNNEWGLTVKW